MLTKTPWTLIRADDGSLSLIDKADPAARANPIATQVKPTEAPLLMVAPQLRGVLSEMTNICGRMFASMPSDRGRKELLERADAVLKASHNMATILACASEPDPPVTAMTDADIETLAQQAMGAAQLVIHNRIGVTEGWFAAQFFRNQDLKQFKEYIREELYNLGGGFYRRGGAKAVHSQTLMSFDGFDLRMTGGNCTALVRELPDGRNIVVTAAESASAYLSEGEAIMIGLYPNAQWDPEQGETLTVSSMDAAERVIAAILAPPGTAIHIRNLNKDTIDEAADAITGFLLTVPSRARQPRG